MFKKFSIFVIMAFLVTPILAVPAPPVGPPDILSHHVNYDAIMYVYQQGIVSGYSDGQFKPSNEITRFEFTKILINAIYTEAEINQCIFDNNNGHRNAIFPDVVGNDGIKWGNYICMAKYEDIVSGYEDGTFRGNQSITFGEASKVISNAFGYTNGNENDSNHKFGAYIKQLTDRKTIPTSIRYTDDLIDRGEMAEMVYRLKLNIGNKTNRTYEELVGITTDNYNYAAKLKVDYDKSLWSYDDNSDGAEGNNDLSYPALEYSTEIEGVTPRIFNPNIHYKSYGADGSFTRTFKYYCAFTELDWVNLSSNLNTDEAVLDLRSTNMNPTSNMVAVYVNNPPKKAVYNEQGEFSFYSYSMPGKQDYGPTHKYDEVTFMYASEHPVNYVLCNKPDNSNIYSAKLVATGFWKEGITTEYGEDILNVFNTYED